MCQLHNVGPLVQGNIIGGQDVSYEMKIGIAIEATQSTMDQNILS